MGGPRWVTRAAAGSAGLIAVLAAIAGCATTTAGQIPVVTPPSVAAHATPVSGPAVTGVVRTASGAPVAGATVIVEVSLSGAEQFDRGFAAFGSLGFSCLAGCSAPHQQGFTARDGSFTVAVPGRNPRNDPYSVTVAVARGPARVATSLSLPPSTRHGLAVGSVLIAAGSPILRHRGELELAVPPRLPAAVEASQPQVVDNTEAGSPPVVDGVQTTVTHGFDPRLLEDERVLITTSQHGIEGRRPALFSSSLNVRGHVVPISRHAACEIEGSRGQLIPQHPCGLTDGVLDTDWQPHDDPACVDGPCPGSLQHNHRDVTVVLQHSVRAALVVVRGCNGCRVSVSVDDRDFTPIGAISLASINEVLVRRLHGRTVRAVRVQTDPGGFFESLREVSVFADGS